MTVAAPDFLGRVDWRLGLGTYRLGVETQSVVKKALRIGYRHIDTAALYNNESAVASAIAASGVKRNDVCVATKIHARDIDRLSIRTATETALTTLGEIDLLMLHNWRPNAPEAWALLAEEASAGRVRAIGVSNFGAADLAALGPPVPSVNQIELSPFLARTTLCRVCAAQGVNVVAHSPLAKFRKLDGLRAIAGPQTPAQLMIAWSLERASATLPRSSNEEHLRENFAAQAVMLSTAQRVGLEKQECGFSTHPKILR